MKNKPNEITPTLAMFNSLRTELLKKFDEISQIIKSFYHKFEEIDHKFEEINHKFEAINQKFEAINKRFDALELKIEARFSSMEAKLSRMLFLMEEQRNDNRITGEQVTAVEVRQATLEGEVKKIKTHLNLD